MRHFAILIVLAIAGGCVVATGLSTSPAWAAQWPSAQDASAALGHGVEIVTPLGNYPDVGESIDVVTAANLAVQGGFNSVRYPIRTWGATQINPPYTIDPTFLSKVDSELDVLTGHGLTVVLSNGGPIQSKAKFLAIWKQLASHFSNRPSSVYFEPANEPEWNETIPLDLSIANILGPNEWNPLVAAVVSIIRSANPSRIIVVTAPSQGYPQAVPLVVLPPGDGHLIVTFHQYQPLQFTHQGAGWIPGSNAWLGTKWEGTPDEVNALKTTMRDAICWSRQTRVPLYLGEFGSYWNGDTASRARYTAAVARLAEGEQIPWDYFELSSGGFGIWDRQNKVWRTALYDALMPAISPAPKPWVDCTGGPILADPGMCRVAGPLMPSGLAQITSEAVPIIAASQTPFEPTILTIAPPAVPSGGVIDYDNTITIDLSAVGRRVLDTQVKPTITKGYGAPLAATAWVTMKLSEVTAIVPLPPGTEPVGTPTITSTGPTAHASWTSGGLVVTLDAFGIDTRKPQPAFVLSLHASIRPVAGAGGPPATPTTIDLKPGPLMFSLDLGIGVLFFGELVGDVSGRWQCQPTARVLAETVVAGAPEIAPASVHAALAGPPPPSVEAGSPATPVAAPTIATPSMTG